MKAPLIRSFILFLMFFSACGNSPSPSISNASNLSDQKSACTPASTPVVGSWRSPMAIDTSSTLLFNADGSYSIKSMVDVSTWTEAGCYSETAGTISFIRNISSSIPSIKSFSCSYTLNGMDLHFTCGDSGLPSAVYEKQN